MSNQITTAFVQQYTTNVALLAQQKGSRLREAVTTGSHTGKAAVPVEQIGLVELQVLATRHADTPIIETPHARRWVSPTPYGGGDMLDEEDKVQALISPTSSYAMAQAAAAGRAWDRAILTAAYGTSKVGADGTTNEAFDTAAFPTGFEIAAGGAGLTVAKIIQARQRIADANVDLATEELYLIVNQKHITDLLNVGAANYVTNAITNRDFNGGVSPLTTAAIPVIQGFKVIQTQLISATQCLAWAKSRMYLGIWKDIESSIDRVPTKNNNWLVQTKTIIGATRLEQAGVVSILTT